MSLTFLNLQKVAFQAPRMSQNITILKSWCEDLQWFQPHLVIRRLFIWRHSESNILFR